jgi:hypothetical protein
MSDSSTATSSRQTRDKLCRIGRGHVSSLSAISSKRLEPLSTEQPRKLTWTNHLDMSIWFVHASNQTVKMRELKLTQLWPQTGHHLLSRLDCCHVGLSGLPASTIAALTARSSHRGTACFWYSSARPRHTCTHTVALAASRLQNQI